MARLAVLLVLLLVGHLASPAEAAGRRVALLIGNSTYAQLPQPRTVSADAEALDDSLRSLGFEVTRLADLDRNGLLRAFLEFGEKSRSADMAVVYFGGHAVQSAGRNYLVPVEAKLVSPAEIQDQTLALDQLVAAISPGGGTLVLLLDASRALGNRTADGGWPPGLAPMTLPGETILAASAAPGQIAADNASGRSAFAGVLARRLPIGGMLEEALIDVARQAEGEGAVRPDIVSTLSRPVLLAEMAPAAGPSGEPATDGSAEVAAGDSPDFSIKSGGGSGTGESGEIELPSTAPEAAPGEGAADDEASRGGLPDVAEAPAAPGSSTTEAAPAPQPNPEPVGRASPPPYEEVTVFYATDRKRTGSDKPNDMYGGDRAPSFVLGTCVVSIPAGHDEGALEQPSLVRLEVAEDPSRHVVLLKATEQSAEDFYRDVSARVAANPGKTAFIFVHGYYVSFRDAARRTAQMTHDLKFKGAPVFFSWPSQASFLGYTADESNIEYAKSDLKRFIADFIDRSGATDVYLVAHSMGNRALASAAAELLRERPDIKDKIKEIILAAPDIDADVFKRDIAPAFAGAGEQVTLYASSSDWALMASKMFHGYPRAGDSGSALTIVKGVDTIDSSEVVTDFFGHSYFAESVSIISDILQIFAGRRDPGARPHLQVVEHSDGRYWKMVRQAQ